MSKRIAKTLAVVALGALVAIPTTAIAVNAPADGNRAYSSMMGDFADMTGDGVYQDCLEEMAGHEGTEAMMSDEDAVAEMSNWMDGGAGEGLMGGMGLDH